MSHPNQYTDQGYLPDAEILALRNRVETEARPLLIEVLGQMMCEALS